MGEGRTPAKELFTLEARRLIATALEKRGLNFRACEEGFMDLEESIPVSDATMVRLLVRQRIRWMQALCPA